MRPKKGYRIVFIPAITPASTGYKFVSVINQLRRRSREQKLVCFISFGTLEPYLNFMRPSISPVKLVLHSVKRDAVGPRQLLVDQQHSAATVQVGALDLRLLVVPI